MDRSTVSMLTTEARLEREAQLRHFESQDAKAGIVLGFSGVLSALGPSTLTLLGISGRSAALMAALVALFAFLPRSFPALDLQVIRGDYGNSESTFLELHLLDTRVEMLGRASSMIERRTRRLRLAVLLLVAAIGLAGLDILVPWRWRLG